MSISQSPAAVQLYRGIVFTTISTWIQVHEKYDSGSPNNSIQHILYIIYYEFKNIKSKLYQLIDVLNCQNRYRMKRAESSNRKNMVFHVYEQEARTSQDNDSDKNITKEMITHIIMMIITYVVFKCN